MRTVIYKGSEGIVNIAGTVFSRGMRVCVSDEWMMATGHQIGADFYTHETLVTDLEPSGISYTLMGAPMDITIIIPQFHTLDLTRQAVETMREFYPTLPLIVVDDGSCDESTEYICGLATGDPNTDAVILTENMGHGLAVHAGIIKATTKRVFVMDSDCIVLRRGFLECMENRMISEGLYGTGVLYHRDVCRGNRYLSCVAAMYDRDVYLTLPPFEHDGDPLQANMDEAARVGAKVEGFPIFNYIRHMEEGTRMAYNQQWDLTGVRGHRILVYGNAYITEVCVLALTEEGYNVVGYVPNREVPTVPGQMTVPEVSPDEPHDLRLSIQFDRNISLDRRPSFNLHTGLLPDFGGKDVLYHTLRRGVRKQGLTFHQMTDKFDQGPIISSISYPVLEKDGMVSLYQRLATIAPRFMITCMEILDSIGLDNAVGCPTLPPTMYRRGEILERDREIYSQTPQLIRELFERN